MFVDMEDDELGAVLRRITELGTQVQHALEVGDVESASAAHAALRALERRRDGLLDARLADAGGGDLRRASTQRPTAERPLREIALNALTYLGGPASTSLVVDVARVRDGVRLPANRLASLRRDEERSHSSGSTRTAYVVPGLTHDRFAPARGVLASSAFPLARRIVAPASGRVDFLTAVITIALDAAGRAADDPQRDGLVGLLWRLARSIPDALGAEIDPDRIVVAARSELALHEAADTAERAEAAERARAQLDPHQQLFGHRVTVVADRYARRA